MTQKKIHIVMGFTGEYSDKQEWLVEAWLDKRVAGERCEHANNWLKEHHMHFDSGHDYKSESKNPKDNPVDKKMRYDWGTGAEYAVVSVPIKDWGK